MHSCVTGHAVERAVRALERAMRHPACPLVVGAAVAAVAFVFVSTRALPLLGGTLATLAIGLAGPWIAVAGVRASVRWDRPRCRVGEPIVGTITRTSPLPWWRPQVSVQWPFATHASPAAGATDGGRERIVVVPSRRGRFPRTAPALWSDRPFGVFVARRPFDATVNLIVWPAARVVGLPADLGGAGSAGQEESAVVTGHSGDPLGARDYRPGDPVKSIHWAHTARCGSLVIRERHGVATTTVRLLIDRRAIRGSAGPAANDDRLDALIGIAFAVIESWHARGVRWEIGWSGRDVFAPPSSHDLTAALDEIACLEPIPADAAAAIRLPCAAAAPVELEMLLTTPEGRTSFASFIGGPAHPPRRRRLWIVAGAATATASARPARGAWDTVLEVPVDADPVATIDALLAMGRHAGASALTTVPRERSSA